MLHYIFVDWAGDPGFHFQSGSSRLLVVSAVVVHDYDALHQEFSVLRNHLGNPTAREFHFVNTSTRVRDAFFAMAEQIAFQATIAVV